jgi:phage terminase large subunit-like protein
MLEMGEGAEVYSCAAEKDQAKIVFGVAKRMVELMEPKYKKYFKPFRDVIEIPTRGVIYKALSAEAYSKEGLNPSLVVFDELHAQPDDELYDVMSNAFGARIDPMLLNITTAGVKVDSTGIDSICYRLYQYGQKLASGEEVDPAFFFAWWGADEGDDPADPRTWAKANPGYGDLLDPEDFEANYKQAIAKGTLNDFKTKRLNMWVDSSRAWLDPGVWDACLSTAPWSPPKKGVVLGFDGSRNGDNTALVAVTVEQDPQVKVLGLWERPDDKPEWRVPRAEVKDVIRQACRDMHVREVAYDPFMWPDAMEELLDEGIPCVEFPQSISRMGPATQRLYELVKAGKLRHDGDPRMARHVGNAIIKTDERGSRLVKDARKSPRKIDLAVATVMAADSAANWLAEPDDDEYVWKDHQGNRHSKPVRDIHFVW